MKKFLLLVSSFLFAFIMGSQFLQVQAFSTVTFDVDSYFDAENITSNTITDATYGSILSFDGQLGSSSGYTFKYWIINDVVEFNSVSTDEFPVVEGMSVMALFSPSDSHLAVFMDSNGKYIGHDYIANEGTATDSGLTLPTKPGYSVSATESERWDKTLTNVTEDTVFILQYVKDTSDTFTLSVTNGTGSGTYDYNQEVTVVADAPSGEDVFSHWEDGNGQVVSLSSSYTLTVLENRTLVAVYDTSAPTDSPLVSIQDLELRDGYHSYVSQIYVPDGFTVLEYGVVTSGSEKTPSLTYDNCDDYYRASIINPNTGEFISSIPKDHYYAKSYLVTKSASEVIEIFYSDLITYSETRNPAVFDFETTTLTTSYTTGSVTVNGSNFYVVDSLKGATTSDPKVGTNSIRVRGVGSIQSEFASESGVDSIHLLYALYGTDLASSFKVSYAYEWAPTTWYDVEVSEGETDIIVDDTALSAVTIDIDVKASIFIKITRTSGESDDRINIDEIIINEYEYSDGTNPIISGAVNATITEGDTYEPITSLVKAIDNYDGDITGSISVTVEDSLGNPVTPGDYSGLSADVYTITLDVEDAALNSATPFEITQKVLQN